MEVATKSDVKEILTKLSLLKLEIDRLKQKEKLLEKRKIFTPIDESMVDIWDNEEDEIWNDC